MSDISIKEEQVQEVNTIASFLAKRDIKELCKKELIDKFNKDKTDLIILLGNAISYTAELTAKAFKDGIGKKIMIVGGIGHSTDYLYNNIRNHPVYSETSVDGRSEADILKEIMTRYLGVDESHIIIENKSTNCGANAVEALKVVQNHNLNVESVMLIQDPTMQLRSYASFKKEWKKVPGVQFISYAPFNPLIKFSNNEIRFIEQHIHGIWSIDRFLSLVMGEIPRLYDDESGYGPKGKGFIDHIDMPEDVMKAYNRLKNNYIEYLNRRKI